MIATSNFIIPEIPVLNPLSGEYKAFWKDLKRSCIEGYWVGGRWMPGNLRFYGNLWHIKLKKGNAKTETLARPLVRDLEWEKAYIFQEARGFSGFEGDKLFTCHKDFQGKLAFYDHEKNLQLFEDYDLDLISENANRFSPITYVPAREYLRRIHSGNLGKPLYENQARNVVDIESRGTGKSYFAAGGMIGWTFLFDGAFDYDEYLEKIKAKTPLSSETLVGAIDAKYTGDLLNKVKLGLDNLPGGLTFNDDYYPSPVAKTYEGTFEQGDFIEAKEKVNIGGTWITRGSKSKIHNRSFKNNPQAGNGTRPALIALEEVGFMGNLVESLGQLGECTADGANKFGTIWMFGTGGDMSGGATKAVKKVFYNPEAYDCVVFEDTFESKGKIGLFVPAYMGLNQFKDEEGNTNVEKALAHVEKDRAKKNTPATMQSYNDELQNRPIKPSEAFLSSSSNKFNKAKLAQALANITIHKTTPRGERGYFVFNRATNQVDWCPQSEGKVIIYEKPIWVLDANVSREDHKKLYTGGYDGIDQSIDESTTDGGSQGVLHIKKRTTKVSSTGNCYVLRFADRPESNVNTHYDQVIYALMYYDCMANIEWSKIGLVRRMEQLKQQHRLMKRPKRTFGDGTTDKESSNLIGTVPNEKNLKLGIEMLQALIEDYWDMLWDEEFVSQLIEFDYEFKGLFDYVLSAIMTEIGDDDQPMYIPPKEEIAVGGKLGYYTDEHGRTQYGIVPDSTRDTIHSGLMQVMGVKPAYLPIKPSSPKMINQD